MLPLLLCMLVGATVCQYDTSWTIQLSRTPTAMRIVQSGRINHQLILAGYSNGQLQIMDAHTKQILKTLHVLDEGVRQIEVRENGVCLVVGSINMVELDHQYNIRRVFHYQHQINHLSLSQLDKNRYFANFQVGKSVKSLQINAETTIYSQIVNNGDNQTQYSIVQMSPNHQYLYTVDQLRQSFKIQKVIPSVDVKTNQISFQNKPYLQRRFSFKIDRLLLGRELNPSVDEQLLMVSQDGTIFYIQAGNIITYIPYTIADSQHFVTAEYCDNGFIAIIHERRINNEQSSFYLTLIRKGSLTSHKVIILDQTFGEISDIERLDCNHNLIVMQSKAKILYVLQSFKVFSFEDYLYHLFITLGISFVILYIFTRKSTDPSQKVTSQSDSSRKQTPQKSATKNPQSKAISVQKKKERKGD